MANVFKVSSVPIDRKLDKNRMSLPDRSMTSAFRIQNHYFERVRSSWRDARTALKFEYLLMRRLENAVDLEKESIAISDGLFECDYSPLQGLDLGVAGTVLTLSAMGCYTIASCNGGCFGDFHHEKYPLVVFFAKGDDRDILLCAAERSGIGISNKNGNLLVWANDIWHMHRFAKAIFSLRWKPRQRRNRRSSL
jgi:hypothetical protein